MFWSLLLWTIAGAGVKVRCPASLERSLGRGCCRGLLGAAVPGPLRRGWSSMGEILHSCGPEKQRQRTHTWGLGSRCRFLLLAARQNKQLASRRLASETWSRALSTRPHFFRIGHRENSQRLERAGSSRMPRYDWRWAGLAAHAANGGVVVVGNWRALSLCHF
jgi:hypothetical protein